MEFARHVSELVGGTPLVALTEPEPGAPLLLAKLEYLNPGGSVKDRIAGPMIDAAEESGELSPGGTIVEPTSGNTGLGLALVGRRRGYRCVFVCPDKVSEEKRNVLTAMGAEVVVCPTGVPPAHPESYYSVSDRLAREIPGGWKPNQYANPTNPQAHVASTGPEIWRQTDGRITHLVAGIGTGGTVSGTGRHLKEVSAGRVTVVGADPEGSVYSGGSGRPYLVEGVGEDFWPSTYDTSVCDEIVAVSDADSFAETRRLARSLGLLVGGSSGMASVAAHRIRHGLPADAVVVVILPDGGRGYLSKIFDDTWMSVHGFLEPADGVVSVGDVLDAKRSTLPAVIHVHPEETVAEAVAVMAEYEVSQLLVVGAEPPVRIGEVIGAIDERGILASIARDPDVLQATVASRMGPPLPVVGAGQPVTQALATLAGSDAVVVLRGGSPAGVVTRQDMIRSLAGPTAVVYAG